METNSGGALGWLDQLGGFIKQAGATYADVKTTLANTKNATSNASRPDQTPTAPTSPIQTAQPAMLNSYVWLAAGTVVLVGAVWYLAKKA